MDLDGPTQPVDQSLFSESDDEAESQIAWGSIVFFGQSGNELKLIEDRDYWFGRKAECDVSIPDARVSSKHCKIFREQEGSAVAIFIEDFSANGTFVNGRKMKKGGRRRLNGGETIVITAEKLETAQCSKFVFQCNTNSTNNDDDIPQQVSEKYDVRNVLGKGAYGEVRRAIDRNSGEHFAIKIIEKKKLGVLNGISDSTLMREVDVLRSLSHPNIIHFRELIVTDKTLFIVTEVVDGGELFDRIVDKGVYSEEDAKIVIGDVLKAVKYLHENNIVHRDLKPENILIASKDDDLHVKISDFGLARVIGDDGIAQTFCGTPQYFAPEVLARKDTIQGRGGYGTGCDMWSCGVILYIILSGCPPFREDTLYDQIAKAKFTFPKKQWSHISDQVKDLIRRLITADSNNRISAEDALGHPWFGGMYTETKVPQSKNAESNFAEHKAQEIASEAFKRLNERKAVLDLERAETEKNESDESDNKETKNSHLGDTEADSSDEVQPKLSQSKTHSKSQSKNRGMHLKGSDSDEILEINQAHDNGKKRKRRSRDAQSIHMPDSREESGEEMKENRAFQNVHDSTDSDREDAMPVKKKGKKIKNSSESDTEDEKPAKKKGKKIKNSSESDREEKNQAKKAKKSHIKPDSTLQACRYGWNCYRKAKDHLKSFYHPWDDASDPESARYEAQRKKKT